MSFSIRLLALSVLFSPGNQGTQYRGPEFETLFPGGLPGGDGQGSGQGQPGASAASLEGFDRWEFWFEINKDVLLRSRRATRVPVLGRNAAAALGSGQVSNETIEKEVLPLLRSAAASKDAELVQFSVQALGKIGHREGVSILEDLLAKGDDETKRRAILALGLIEDRKALVRLVNLLEGENVSEDLRAFAALAVGLRGSAETVPILKSYIDRHLNVASAGGDARNVMVAAVGALGMSRNRDAVPLLIQKFKTLDQEAHSRSRAVLCMILTALGRIGDASALNAILSGLVADDIEIRRAAALACGDLGDSGAVEALAKTLQSDSDVQTRGFAAVSLGRIGGQKAREALREGFATKKSRTVKSFCAIALGLAGDEGSAEELRKLLFSPEDESLRSAAALGLGFLRDQASVPAMLDLVESASNPARLRGYVAIAIGLIRPDGPLARLLTVLREDRGKLEDFRRGLLLGIGLFRDPVASSELIKILSEEKNEGLRGHAALALGMTRDRMAVSALGEILSGKRKGAQAEDSYYACVALGALGDRYNYPLLSEFFFNANYRLRVEIVDRVQKHF